MGSGVLDHDTINCCDQPERRRIRKLFARRPSHLTLNKMIWLLNTYQVLNHSWKGPACTRWPSPGDATRKYEAVDRAWFFLLALVHTHQLPSLKAEACWRDDQVSRLTPLTDSDTKRCSGYVCYPAALFECHSLIAAEEQRKGLVY